MLHLLVTDDESAWRVAWTDAAELTVGRGPGCDIAIPDPRLERVHLTLRALDDGRGVEVEAQATVDLDATDESLHRGDRRRLEPEERVAFGAFVLQAAAVAGPVGAAVSDAGAASTSLERLRRAALDSPASAAALYREGLRRGDAALCALGLAAGPPSAAAWARLLMIAAGDGGSWDSEPSAELVALLDARWPDRLREAPQAWLSPEALQRPEGLWQLVRAVRLRDAVRPELLPLLLGGRSPRAPGQVRHIIAEGARAAAALLAVPWDALSGAELCGVGPDGRALVQLVTRVPPTLHTLGLTAAELDDAALEVLARTPRPAGLRVLDLGHNPFGPRGLEALRRAGWLDGLEALSVPVDAVRPDASTAPLGALLGAMRLTLTPSRRGARAATSIGEVVVRANSVLERRVTGAQVEVELSPSGQAWSDRHRLRFRLDAPSGTLRYDGGSAALEALGLSPGEQERLARGELACGEWLAVGAAQLTLLLADDFAALWRGADAPSPGLPPSCGIHLADGVSSEPPGAFWLGVAHRGEGPWWRCVGRERLTVGLEPARCELVLVGVGIALRHLTLVREGAQLFVEREPDARGVLPAASIDGRPLEREREPLGASETLFIGPYLLRAWIA